jgi:hypothetical protein
LSFAGRRRRCSGRPPRPRRAPPPRRRPGMLRHVEPLRILGALLRDDLHDVGDHVAGALEDDGVADADVLPLDLVHVVEDAFRTVTPPTATGSSSATGVSTPVRPTDGRMALTRVVAWRARNLYATAQRGEREICPSGAGARGRSPSRRSRRSRTGARRARPRARRSRRRSRRGPRRGSAARLEAEVAKRASSSAYVFTGGRPSRPSPWQTRSSGAPR